MPPSTRLSEPVVQYELFSNAAQEAIVNVASVPQRSPFRYPGGKTWLVPRLRQWLASQSSKPRVFVEPFAGGGISSLTVAFENLADEIVMAELDDDVAAVWQAILGPDNERLAARIVSFSMTAACVEDELSRTSKTTLDRAFQTILRNRVNRGGILAPGVGRIKEGENGRGISSRWYPQTLANRIRAIAQVAPKMRFVCGDGLRLLEDYADRADAVSFVDPPYTAGGKRAGARLYAHSELDHDALFCAAARLSGDFLLTYDNAEDVRGLAARHGLAVLAVPMKSTHHAAMTELLIGRNLGWA